MKNKILSIIGLILFGIAHTVPVGAQWTLSNDDTYMTISVSGNNLYIDTLRNPAQGWNWIQSPSEVPLLSSVKYSGTTYPITWTYQDSTVVQNANSKMITLRFSHSTTPKLELKSIWYVNTGSGPVENWMTIENKTNGNVTYFSTTAAANIQIRSNNTVNLFRFDKTNVGWGKVYNDVIGANANFSTSTNIMPYIMLDVGSVHGLYLGFEWEIGKFQVSSGADSFNITASVLPITEDVIKAKNEFFIIPNVYYGTYKGDIDDGSNRFKKWFWNYKITRSLYNNTNEPWVMACITPGGTTPQGTYDYYAALGVEGVKMDYWDSTWTCWYTNRDWMYHSAVWPSGFDFGLKAHNAGLKASLYMGGTYNDCDLTTIAGRDAELSAILNRYDWGWFDMWRTDIYDAPYIPIPQTYNGVTNFLYIQDSLINSRPDYRYENCANGGTYKGFEICRRMTFCTMNDEGYNAAMTRSTYYSNSYAINPVQLRSDHTGTSDLDYRTDMMGAWMSNLPNKNMISLYKNKQRPILRGADVYHILPMADGINWDGLEYFNTDINKGSVFLFKPSEDATDGSSKVINLKGLDNNTKYTLEFQDRTQLNCVMTGEQLMNDGINVTGMYGEMASEIIWLDGNPVVLSTVPSGRCGAGVVTLHATASYGTLNWYADSTGGSSLGTGESYITPSLSTSTTYYVQASEGGSSSLRIPVTATIGTSLPPAPTNTSGSHKQAICSGNTTTLNASGTGSLSWYSDSTGGTYLGSGTSFTTPVLNSTTIYYVQDSTCGASATRTGIAVKVYNPGITSVTPSTLCTPGTLILGATANTGTINWYEELTGGNILETGTSYITPSLSTSQTYYVDNVVSGGQNFLLYSEQFNNAAWLKVNATVVTNTTETTDPLGGYTAEKYIEQPFTGVLSAVYQYFSVLTPITCSVYLKKGTASWVLLSVHGTGYCWFDLQNGVTGLSGGGIPPTPAIESVGSGWYRCSVTNLYYYPDALSILITTGDGVLDHDADGSKYVYLWGAQVNHTPSALNYQQTTETTVNDYADGCECTSARTPVTATINPDITTTTNGATISSNQNDATYQWIDCNNGLAIIPGENNQSYTAVENGSYAVIVNVDGCIDTSECVNIINVIAENNLTETVKIFPNPVKDEINFLLNINHSSLIEINIYNIWGNKILSKNEPIVKDNDKISMNVNNLPNGFYFISFKTESIEYRSKFIKLE